MKLSATVANILLKAIPKSILIRLLDDEELTNFARVSVIGYGGIGSFQHSEISNAVEKAKIEQRNVDIVAQSGEQYVLIYDKDGFRIGLKSDSGGGYLIPELDFVAPDSETRLAALRRTAEDSWPSFPSTKAWKDILEGRPLTEFELSNLLEDIRETPSRFLLSLKNKWNAGEEISVDDFFPSSLSYYSSLIGFPSLGATPDEWLCATLIPDIQQNLASSLNDGLRRALILNAESRLSPIKFLGDVSATNLFPALHEFASRCCSPFALFSILELSLFYAKDDSRFIELAETSIDKLIGETSKEPRFDKALKLLAVFYRIGLGKISVSCELLNQPLFWRRLAAFAHANALVETLDISNLDADQFVRWVDQLETNNEVAAFFLDLGRDPIWRSWDIEPRRIKASIIGRICRIKALCGEAKVQFPRENLVSSAWDKLKAEGLLIDTQQPSPLSNSGRLIDRHDVERSDSGSLADFFLTSRHDLENDPMGRAWQSIAFSCRFIRFDEELVEDLTKAVRRIVIPSDEEGRHGFFVALTCAAEAAAAQPCQQIADEVALVIIRYSNSFQNLSEAESGYRILMTAAAAFSQEEKRMAWMVNQLTNLAYSLPRGDMCRHLLANLEALQTLIPIGSNLLGRARKFAAAAIA